MDKTTKVLLALIAAGLWANALVPAAHAQFENGFGVMNPSGQIAVDIRAIANGSCGNKVLCAR